MRDLDERLRDLNGLEAPDLWGEIRSRHPRRTAQSSARSRWAVVAISATVAALGVLLIVRAFFDQGGPAPTTKLSPGPVGLSSWQIAFTRMVDGSPRVFVAGGDGTDAHELVGGSGPSWSPDGTSLLFVRNLLPGGAEIDIATFPAGQVATLYNLPPPESLGLKPSATPDSVHPSWFPDGSRILFRGWDGIYTMDADGSNVFRITSAFGFSSDMSPAWSPDGSRILFVHGTDTGHWYLTEADADGTNQLVLTDDRQYQHYPRDPSWSPDGSRIAFAAGPGGEDTDIWLIYPDGTGETDITKTPDFAETQPAWSPDGQWIAFSGPDGLYVMRPDGSGRTRVTTDSSDRSPAWNPVPETPPTPTSRPTPTQGPSTAAANGEIWGRIGGGDGPSFVYSFHPDGSGKSLLFATGAIPTRHRGR